MERRNAGTTAGTPTRSIISSFHRSIVVCNLSTSLVVEDAAREVGAQVVRTPVGEVHVARAIVRLGAVIGGEGNGGGVDPPPPARRGPAPAAAPGLGVLPPPERAGGGAVAGAPRHTI